MSLTTYCEDNNVNVKEFIAKTKACQTEGKNQVAAITLRDGRFQNWCSANGIIATKRQAQKFLRGTGIAFSKLPI